MEPSRGWRACTVPAASASTGPRRARGTNRAACGGGRAIRGRGVPLARQRAPRRACAPPRKVASEPPLPRPARRLTAASPRSPPPATPRSPGAGLRHLRHARVGKGGGEARHRHRHRPGHHGAARARACARRPLLHCCRAATDKAGAPARPPAGRSQNTRSRPSLSHSTRAWASTRMAAWRSSPTTRWAACGLGPDTFDHTAPACAPRARRRAAALSACRSCFSPHSLQLKPTTAPFPCTSLG